MAPKKATATEKGKAKRGAAEGAAPLAALLARAPRAGLEALLRRCVDENVAPVREDVEALLEP